MFRQAREVVSLRSQRQRLSLALLAVLSVATIGAAAVLTNLPAHADTTCTVSPLLVNSCRPWLGGNANGYPGITPNNVQNQILAQESRIGRQVDVAHTYHTPGQDVLNSNDLYFINRANTILYTNWKPATVWSTANGSNATVNATIDGMADSIKAVSPHKIILTIYHEPEANVTGGAPSCPASTIYKGSSGTPADYRAMWQNVRNRFDAKGITNVVWAMNYQSYSTWDCMVKDLWPGNNLVDWVTWDPYSGGGTSFAPFNTSTANFYNKLLIWNDTDHNFAAKPWGLAEWNINQNYTQAQATQYYDDAKIAVSTNLFPRLKLYIVFDNNNGVNTRVGYDASGVLDATKQAHYTSFAAAANFSGAWMMADTTPPTASLTTPTSQSIVSGNAMVSGNVADDTGVVSAKLLVDGGDSGLSVTLNSGNASVLLPTASLSNGSHSLAFQVADAAGNSTTSVTVTVTVDNADHQAPTMPQNLTGSATPTQVNLSWDAASDDIGVTNYSVVRNSTVIATVSTPTYTDSSVSPSTNYSYQVSAADAAANASPFSTAFAVSTPALPDTTAPSVPAGFATTNVTGTEVDLSWLASSDDTAVTGYHLYRGGVLLATLGASFTSYADTTVTDATTYSYSLDAFDAVPNTTAQTVGLTVTTPDITAPTAPFGLTVVATTPTSVQLSWMPANDNVGVTTYTIVRDGTTLVTLTGSSSYIDTSVSSLTSYSYQVLASDAAGNSSAPSSSANVTTPITPDVTPPSTPTNLLAQVTSASTIEVSWTAATDDRSVANYQLFRNGDFIAIIFGGPHYIDSGLTDATTYSYTVRAVDTSNNSGGMSDPASATTPDVTVPNLPTNLSASTVTGHQISLSWTTSTDNVTVAGYHLYRGGVLIATLGNATSYTDSALTDATTYSYSLDAFDAAGNTTSPTAALAVVTPDVSPPSTPVNLVTIQLSAFEVDVSWTAATDNVAVTGYHLYRNGSLLASLGAGATSYADTTVTDATSYSYSLDAFDAAGNQSAQTASLSLTTPDGTPPSSPTMTASPHDAHAVQLSWTTSTDNVAVTGYRVYRGASLLTTTTELSYLDTDLTDATTYLYSIVAFDTTGNAAVASPLASATTPDGSAPSLPTGLQTTGVTGHQINLSWTASTDNVVVTGYHLYRGGSLLATLGAGTNAYTDSGLTDATSYSYSLDAFDAAGNTSVQTGNILVATPDVTPPTTPIALATSLIKPFEVDLSWTAGTDNVAVIGYHLYRNGTLLATLGAGTTSYVDTTVSDAALYNYSLDAFDAADNTSNQSSGLSLSTPDGTPPTSVTLTALASGPHAVQLSWTASTDNVAVAGYRVYRGATLLTTTTNTSYTDGGLTDATTYSYNVVAFDAAANSTPASAFASATTPDGTAPVKPTGLAGIASSATQINLTWTATTDNVAVTGYHLYRAGILIATLGSVTSYQDKTVTAKTTYQYSIDAFDAAGNATAQTTSVSVTTPADTTPPSVPTSLTGTTSAAKVILTWAAASDNIKVTGYTIYRNGVKLTTTTALTYTNGTGVQGATYQYTVDAFDAAGNHSAQTAAVSVKVPDITAPTKPASLTVTPGVKTNVLKWTASTDNIAVAGYQIYRGTTLIATVGPGVTSFTDTGLTPSTTYSYRIVAFDAAGNLSASSTTVSGKAK